MSAPFDRLTKLAAYSVRVTGIVQGVGFRPFVYRLATSCGLSGWVANGEHGVEIVLEGNEAAIQAFLHELTTHPPQRRGLTKWSSRRSLHVA